MIQYDYLLERNYKSEKREFKPDGIPKELANIVYIEGPNSSGKSTLLNIIALGFHGLKEEKMNPALKNKLNDLFKAKHQKIKFNIKIVSKDEEIILTSVKESFDKQDIIVREMVKGKDTLLTPDAFHRKYNLIYDIPDNPTERLNQLIHEIKDSQKFYGSKINALRTRARALQDEVKRGRDPKTIEALKSSIARVEGDIVAIEEKLKLETGFLDDLERYVSVRFYCYFSEELRRAKTKISKAKKEMKAQEATGKKRNIEFVAQKRNLKDSILQMQILQQEISSLLDGCLPKAERHHLNVWMRIDLDKALEECELSDTLFEEISIFKQVMFNLVNDEQKKKNQTEAKVYSDLLDLLGHYRETGVVIPGINKSIDEFIVILEKSNEQYRTVKTYLDNIKNAEEKLDLIEKKGRECIPLLERLKVLKDNTEDAGEFSSVDEDAQNELGALEEKREQLQSSLDFYVKECAKKDIYEENAKMALSMFETDEKLEPYLTFDENQLKHEVLELRTGINSKQKTLRDKQNELTIKKNDLTRIQDVPVHKLQDQLANIGALIEKMEKLEQKIKVDFNSYIESIIKGGTNLKNTEEESAYFAEVAKYLGRKVGYIRHLDREYKVEKIDLINGEIEVEQGTIIRLTDMGTGQSQSAYLLGLLNTDDKRKIIALFDEVAAMDDYSLRPVYKKLNQLYTSNKLLFGAVVQKGALTKAIDMVGVD